MTGRPANRPPPTASDHVIRPATNASQVAPSVSTTFGGVPRVCVGPATACTAAYGGTRISTDRPGLVWASHASVTRTAGAI